MAEPRGSMSTWMDEQVMPGTPVAGEGNRSEHPRIGILSPLVAGSYASNLIAGVTTAARALVPRFPLRPAWDQVSGFLVVLNAVEPWYLQALRDAGKPVVMLSHEEESFPCPVVSADNRSGVIQAVAHLVEHGHRRIAFAGCLVQSDITERLDAYLEALASHGIEADRDLVFEATDN